MLTFSVLRETNVVRCQVGFGHTIESWSVAEWGNAAAGEGGEAVGAYLALATINKMGEANNLAKKLLRFRDKVGGNLPGKSESDYRRELGKEIADMVIYADLWAASQGIDLGNAVREAFNNKSDELGCSIKLP